jgi:23S rRNA pseudouridine1911/1915/1917 synthase
MTSEEINNSIDLLQEDAPEEITQDGGPLHAQITIRRNRNRGRIDKYLQGRFPRFSRTAMQNLIKEGAVTVNGRLVKPSYQIVPADVIELILPPPEAKEITAEPIPLTILFEDEYLIAVNKPANMVVHPARGYQSGTLVNALMHYCQSLSHGDDPVRPGIVHRLDKDTTGVIIAAKNDEAHWRMALQFERRRIHKEYQAVVEGNLELDSDRIDRPIGSHPYIRERYAVRPGAGRDAVTVYQVVERLDGFTHLKLLPETGRTHQLRVHLSFLRHPIVADTLYGGRKLTMGDLLDSDDPTPAIDRFALHAHRLEFCHPITGKPISLEAPLPADFRTLLDTLRKRTAVRK